MKLLSTLTLIALFNTLTACGGGDSGPGNASCPEPEAVCNGKAEPKVNWESIPSAFNPQVQSEEFSIESIKAIRLRLQVDAKDVSLVYSDALASQIGTVDIYTVQASDAKTTLRGTSIVAEDDSISVSKFGNYQCALEVENGTLTALQGACYVRVVVTLPVGAKVELYRRGQLVSSRFFAMSVEDLLESLSDLQPRDEKSAVIDEFIQSYQALGRQPVLAATEVGAALSEFSFGDNKLPVLTKLHPFVRDRESLRAMIADQFNSLDEKKALEIVGL